MKLTTYTLTNQFGVDEIHRFSGAYPDTVVYSVRVSGAPLVSYVMQDYFVFFLSDSTSCAPFAAACDTATGVQYAHVPVYASAMYDPDDPYLGSHVTESSNGYVGVKHAWDVVRSGEIKIGIIDSGIDRTHPDFAGITISGDNNGPYPDGPAGAHGTLVAGIVGARQSNGYATSGMCQVELVNIWNPWNTTNSDPDHFIQHLSRLMGDEAVVAANYSGSVDEIPHLENICAAFYNSNRLLFCSAGNSEDAVRNVNWPARYLCNVAVSAITSGGVLRYLNVGPSMDFTAPGDSVWSTTTVADGGGINDNCKKVSGTSFSTPIVAGAAALLWSYCPSLYNDDVFNLLEMSARTDLLQSPYPTSYEDAFGNGLVRIDAAVDSLLMNALVGGTASGYSRRSETAIGQTTVANIPRYPYGSYNVWVNVLEKDITFPTSFVRTPRVWGRGAATSGVMTSFSAPIIIDQKHVCSVVDGSVTNTGCTLRTCVYRFQGPLPLYTNSFWYPTSPENVTWGYAALGKDGVVAVDGGETESENGMIVSPNPGNPKTTIRVAIARGENVEVRVYDVRGRLVRELYSGQHGLELPRFSGRSRPDTQAAS